jgi:hypothetical protein
MESKGISDICVQYKDIIWKNINDYIKNNINNLELKIFIFNFNNDKFLINNLVLEFSFREENDNICNAKFIGSNSRIKDNIFYSPKIEFKIYYKQIDDEFLTYIESVLLHELLHCYQMYKQNNKRIPSYWQYGSVLSQVRGNILKYNNEDINHIMDLLYYSLEHEMNAQLHQYYDYLLKFKKYRKINKIENELRNYIIPINIDDKFISLLKYIITHFKNSLNVNSPNNNYKKNINNSLWSYELTDKNVVSFLKNLKNYFTNCADYINSKKRQIDRKIKNDEHIDYTMKLSETDIFFKLIND